MTTSWVNEAGILGAVIAFLIGGAIILAIGLVYGELTAALPLAGGEFAFIYRAMGRNSAWLVGWIMTLAYMGVAAWEGIALATAIDYILPILSLAADGDCRLSGRSVMGAGGCCRCSQSHNPAESDRREIGTSFSGHGTPDRIIIAIVIFLEA